MKLLTFFISLLSMYPLYADTVSDCNKLAEIIRHYEVNILKSASIRPEDERGNPDQKRSTCDQNSVTLMIKKANPTLSSEQVQSVREYACRDLNSIDAKIATLENEQSSLMGFAKLKTDIALNKEQAANKDVKKAQLGGMKFVDALNAGKSLEQMINTGDLLKKLKTLPLTERDTLPKLMKVLDGACKGINQGACDKKSFTPNAEAFEAISGLIEKNAVSDADIKKWQNALKITRKDDPKSPYSFTQMSNDLEARAPDIEAGKLSLNHNQLRAIQSLASFTDDNALGLGAFSKELKPFELVQQYKIHTADLLGRQEYEIQSQINYLAKRHPQVKCPSIHKDGHYGSAVACLEDLRKEIEGLDSGKQGGLKAQSLETLEAIDVGRNHLSSLQMKHSSCLDMEFKKEDLVAGKFPDICTKAFSHVDRDLKSVSDEIRALLTLKDKIGSQNTKNMAIRNVALDQFQTKCSPTVIRSELECTYEKGLIAQEVEILSSDVLDLMIVKKDSKNSSIEDACNSKPDGFPYLDDLCKITYRFKKPNPDSRPLEEAAKKEAEFNAPTEVEDSERRALITGLGNIASGLAGDLYRNWMDMNNAGVSPYYYNYSALGNVGPMGISDTILFNARYYGAYGFYMPTLGYQPTTSFGAYSRSSYTFSGYSSTGNSSSYFKFK